MYVGTKAPSDQAPGHALHMNAKDKRAKTTNANSVTRALTTSCNQLVDARHEPRAPTQ